MTRMRLVLSFTALFVLGTADAFIVHPKTSQQPCSLSYFSSSALYAQQPSFLPKNTSNNPIVVIGGTSGVGQLVTNKLVQRDYVTRVTCRDPSQSRPLFPSTDIQLQKLDLVQGITVAQLDQALGDAQAVVISVGTTAFPTIKWKNGNTPQAIDDQAVTRIAEAATRSTTVRKIVLVTSVGVERTSELPFSILNLFGVLDAKKAGEEAVKRSGCDHVIIRPGRLVGGPFTNLDVANLLKIKGGAENGVDIAFGDSLLGDCKRDAVAEAVVQALLNVDCKNVAFSVVSNDKRALTNEEWAEAFASLRS